LEYALNKVPPPNLINTSLLRHFFDRFFYAFVFAAFNTPVSPFTLASSSTDTGWGSPYSSHDFAAWVVADVVQAQAQVAIYASLAVFIYCIYGMRALFAAVTLDCDQVFPCANNISTSDNRSIARERSPHRSVYALDG
jgi:hypothetical protein